MTFMPSQNRGRNVSGWRLRIAVILKQFTVFEVINKVNFFYTSFNIKMFFASLLCKL